MQATANDPWAADPQICHGGQRCYGDRRPDQHAGRRCHPRRCGAITPSCNYRSRSKACCNVERSRIDKSEPQSRNADVAGKTAAKLGCHRGAIRNAFLFRRAWNSRATPAAARAQIRRHVRRARQPRRYRQPPSGGSGGLVPLDTRHLSRLEVLVNGAPPLLLGSNLRDDNSALFVDLTNPDLMDDQRIVLEKDTRSHPAHDFPVARHGLSAARRAQLRRSAPSICSSRSCSRTILPICSRCAARTATGAAPRRQKLHGDDQVLLIYHGLDGKTRRTALTFDPPPDRLTTGCRRLSIFISPPAKCGRCSWR